MDTIPLSTSSLANGVRFGMCGYIAEGGEDRPYSRRYIKSIKWNVQCPTGNMECSSSTQAQYCAAPEGAVPAVGKFALNVLLVAALFDSPFWILQCTFYLISFPFISSPSPLHPFLSGSRNIFPGANHQVARFAWTSGLKATLING